MREQNLSLTAADTIALTLQQAGVQRLFGMPGGGSNADLVEAAVRAELPFTLAHTETASAFMASAQAEISGRPGACLATRSMSTASAIDDVMAKREPKVRTAHRMMVSGEASSSRHAARRASASRCSASDSAGSNVGIGEMRAAVIESPVRPA